MKFSCTPILCSLSLMLVGACGDDVAPYQRLVNAQADFGTTLCECAEAIGITEADCRVLFVPDESSASERACIDAVVADNEAEFNDSADCIVEIYAETTACFRDVNACDEEAIDDCVGAFAGDVDDCPALTEEVVEAIDDCVE